MPVLSYDLSFDVVLLSLPLPVLLGLPLLKPSIDIGAYGRISAKVDLAFGYDTYGIIQALDGNVLVPLLFSEAVNLHPVAIICAVLLFGGLWGFWGVFFAIPLATLFKAVINAWPRTEPEPAQA